MHSRPQVRQLVPIGEHPMRELSMPLISRLPGLVHRAVASNAMRRVDPFIAELARSLFARFCGGVIYLMTSFFFFQAEDGIRDSDM